MPKRKTLSDWLTAITVPNDGVTPVRSARGHSRDKLGIIASYAPAFATACKNRAPRFYMVDGLAGEGLYYFADSDTHVLGSTLITLEIPDPPFSKVLSMELKPRKKLALEKRVAKYGSRAVVEQGDCNTDLLAAMKRHIPTTAPILVFLDPEGIELEWQTVEKIAKFRAGARKVELLILVPTSSIGRAAEVEWDPHLEGASRIDYWSPSQSKWREIWGRRTNGELTAEECRDQLADDYVEGLKRLGYQHVKCRPIRRRGTHSASAYHLVFASDHDVGDTIMSDVFEKMHLNEHWLEHQLPMTLGATDGPREALQPSIFDS